MKTGGPHNAQNNIEDNAKDNWKPDCSMNSYFPRQLIDKGWNCSDLDVKIFGIVEGYTKAKLLITNPTS